MEVFHSMILNDKEQILRSYEVKVVDEIVLKSLTWKIGKPNNRIRKAGMINYNELIAR